MNITRMLGFLLCSLFFTAITSAGDRVPLQRILPAPSCFPGWVMEQKIVLYNEDTLSDRIDGEAELFFSYGFRGLVSARYENQQDTRIAVDADVYELGSALDAFGMFANYRKDGDGDAGLGTESALNPSQLFFYQDRYLVRIQATGTLNMDNEIFLACGRAISQNLPRDFSAPRIVEIFNMPGIINKSPRYLGQSVLGYDFFRRGLTADAILDGEPFQLFVIIEDSDAGARNALDRYLAYLKQSLAEARTANANGTFLVRAADPLYGTVLIAQCGRYLIGADRVKNIRASTEMMKAVKKRLPNDSPK